MNRRLRVDKNHSKVIRGIRCAGYQVFDTHRAGDGFPDIVVQSKSNPPQFVLFEIKSEDDTNGLRGKEVDFFKKTLNAPRLMIKTIEAALDFLSRYD